MYLIQLHRIDLIFVQIWTFFWSVFSCIWSEYADLQSKSLYSVRIKENTGQKNLRIWTLFTQCLNVSKITFVANVVNCFVAIELLMKQATPPPLFDRSNPIHNHWLLIYLKNSFVWLSLTYSNNRRFWVI